MKMPPVCDRSNEVSCERSHAVHGRTDCEAAARIRVAFAIRTFDSASEADIATYVRHAARVLVASGAEVFIVSETPIDAPAGVRKFGDATIVPTDHLNENLRHLDPHVAYSDRVYNTLVRLARRIHLDAVEFADVAAEGFMSIRAKRTLNAFADTTLVVRLHSSPSAWRNSAEWPGPSTVHDSIRGFAEGYAIKNADVVTSASQELAHYATTHLGRSDVLRTAYPMDVSILRRGAPTSPDRRRDTAMYVGPMSDRSALDTFISAAEMVLSRQRQFHFEIYGTGPSNDAFGRSYADLTRRRMPSHLASRIVFRDQASDRQRAAAFSRAQYCLLPSWWGGWPYACLEAMGHGCIVLAGNPAPVADFVEHGVSGFVGDPHDPETFAAPILATCESSSLRFDVSSAAKRRAELLASTSSNLRRPLFPYEGRRGARTWRTADHTATVSVVIPLFNQGRFLPEAIDSVRASSYRNIEILVVNDGSTDEHTRHIFNATGGVTKIDKANGGLASARNAGIELSGGEFVLPLDADDRIHSEYIEAAVDALVNNPDLAYVTCYAKNFGEFDSVYAPIGSVPELMLYINTDGRCTSLFRRKVLETVGGYDTNLPYYEDWDLLIRLNKKGFLGDVLPEEYFSYRRHRDSMIYTRVNERRAFMIQHLMTRHADLLARHQKSTIFNLVHLWKSGLEVNQSVQSG